jgi:hypothetical protein
LASAEWLALLLFAAPRNGEARRINSPDGDNGMMRRKSRG